jgi:hypothetical protein
MLYEFYRYGSKDKSPGMSNYMREIISCTDFYQLSSFLIDIALSFLLKNTGFETEIKQGRSVKTCLAINRYSLLLFEEFIL